MKKPIVKLLLKYKHGDFFRRIAVPGNLSLSFLHFAIQTAFGWLNIHEYMFEGDEKLYTREGPDGDFAMPGVKYAARTPIESLLGKKGDRCIYTYDLGDDNEVDVVCEGRVEHLEDVEFDVKGPDLIEDSAAFGFTEGIVELLGKKRRSKRAAECVKWLAEAHGLAPENVLRTPSEPEMAVRVVRLVNFVLNSIP
ncbi:MAG: plasmid pRiA4b ORF-3 family protein [Kiritimatiellae bacterium]|nr:plasmid pRiA4b ORF-3 family protein [Kiritimatiellia bacterium]